jgi:dTDP-D-glucose 4,6-dehydratase
VNGWKDFKTEDEISVMNTRVGDQLAWQLRQQIEQGIRKLVDRWTKCVAKQGDYVKK